jgi:hypothetical protein
MLVRRLIVAMAIGLCWEWAAADVIAACRPGLGCGPPRIDRPLSEEEKLDRETHSFAASCFVVGFLGAVMLFGLSQIALQIVAHRRDSASRAA